MVCLSPQLVGGVDDMERIFSFDDIAGTIWHACGDLSYGVQSSVGGNEGESVYDMKRSASEFAFQEFIAGSGLKQYPEDALTYVSSDDEAANDEDTSRAPARDEAHNDEDVSGALVPDEAKVHEERSRKDRSKPSEPKNEDASRTGRPSASKAGDQRGSSPSKPKETVGKRSSKEPEIKAALNPLFSGLVRETTPPSAAHDQQYYKEKLDELCLHARTSRTSAIRLGEVAQGDRPAPVLQSIRQPGPESATSRSSSGGLTPESQGSHAVPNKPVTSGSSQDQTDDEEFDNENLEPGDKKRVKRMLSNRESARRSRRRKQAHLNELESQVAQLRVQNSSLAANLQTTNQKLKDASKDNLQLKTYVEMLRAKLLAATTLQRQLVSMGSGNMQSHARSALGAQDMPAMSRSFGWDAGVVHGMQAPRMGQYLMNPTMGPVSLAEMKSQQLEMEQQASLTVQQGMKMSRTPSMQRVGSMDHLKKKNRNAPATTSWDSSVNFADLEGPAMIPQFSLSSDY